MKDLLVWEKLCSRGANEITLRMVLTKIFLFCLSTYHVHMIEGGDILASDLVIDQTRH